MDFCCIMGSSYAKKQMEVFLQMNVLVVNAGSSSLKYQLFDTTSDNVLAKGICDRIGIDGSKIEHKHLFGLP